MKRHFKALVLLLLLSTNLWAAERLTFIYYYAWYGNPQMDGDWVHWTENGHRPPNDLASTFYPKLGAYSSKDPAVVDQHMRWIRESGIDVLIYSWWGRNDSTDSTARAVFDAAADYGLRIAFLIEPYEGRTIHRIHNDIGYLNERFERHPAFFRFARNTRSSQNPEPRGMFLLYAPDYPDHELRRLSNLVHQPDRDSLLLIQSNNLEKIETTKADGIFLYNPADLDLASGYKTRIEATRNTGDIYIPSVAPGFNKNRLARGPFDPYLSRKKGETYDAFWRTVISAGAEFVSIISFNEWHEGTQIEPAVRGPKSRLPYLSYHGTYKKSGIQAQESYLRRTARWIRRFQQLP